MIDLIGQKFGRLTVIEECGRDKFRQVMWKCKCECGNEVIVRGYALRSGNTQSCGCFQKENASKEKIKHGLHRTRLYNIWCGMKERCSIPSSCCYKYYGGRGITVCSEWNDFSAFMEWALSHGYTDNLTIDRKDTNGNYCPENCRWITLKEQQSNKRSNHYIEFNGERLMLKDWAQRIGISHATLLERIERWGSIEEALTIPKGGKQRWGLY